MIKIGTFSTFLGTSRTSFSNSSRRIKNLKLGFVSNFIPCLYKLLVSKFDTDGRTLVRFCDTLRIERFLSQSSVAHWNIRRGKYAYA